MAAENIFRKALFFETILIIILISTFALAAQPQTVAVSGKLTNAAGSALSGSYNFTFQLYNAQSGGTPLWSEPHDGRAGASNVATTNGAWSTVLGNNTTLGLPWNETYFLELVVNGEALSPRTAFSAVPYILNSTLSGAFNFSGGITFSGANTFSGVNHFTSGVNLSVTANNITSGTLSNSILSPVIFTVNSTGLSAANISSGTLSNSILSPVLFTVNSTGLSAANISSGTLSIARLDTIVSTLNATQTFSGVNTFNNTNHFTSGFNASLAASNFTNATFTRAISIVFNSGAGVDVFNITDGTNVFIKADGGNRQFRINGGLGPDAFNITNGANRVFDIDTLAGYVRITGPAGGTADAFNVTRGDGTRIFDVDTANRRMSLRSAAADALNISTGTNRIFDIDASGSTSARFSAFTNFTSTVNISVGGLTIGTANVSQNIPAYWNLSTEPFYNSTGIIMQTGKQIVSCGGASPTPNTTIRLGKAYSGTGTYNIFLTIDWAGTGDMIGGYGVAYNITSTTDFNILCNANTNKVVSWMTVGY